VCHSTPARPDGLPAYAFLPTCHAAPCRYTGAHGLPLPETHPHDLRGAVRQPVRNARRLDARRLSSAAAALLVYIVLGTIALKRGRSPAVRAGAFAAALAAFGYIVGVALTKDPRFPLSFVLSAY
jgi:hypothetical protein